MGAKPGADVLHFLTGESVIFLIMIVQAIAIVLEVALLPLHGGGAPS